MIYQLGNVNNEINTDKVTTGLQRRFPFESLRCTSLSTTPLCLPNVSNDFKQIWIFLDRFSERRQSVEWEQRWDMRKHRRTDRDDEGNRREYANTPKNRWRYTSSLKPPPPPHPHPQSTSWRALR